MSLLRFPLKSLFLFLAFAVLTACGGASHQIRTSADSYFTTEPNVRVKIAGRRKTQTLEIPMETYLAGVIGHEMSILWHKEALKAQTVAARSYALSRIYISRKQGRAFDMVNTQADQVFHEHTSKNDYLRGIVEQTRGQVLSKDGRIVQAYYSSTCGGKMETSIGAGLSKDSPLNKFGSDNFCQSSPFRTWSYSMSLSDLAKKFRQKGYPVKDLQSIKIKSHNPSGYVNKIEYKDQSGTHAMAAKDFRQIVGSYKLKSLLFDVANCSAGNVSFLGHGFGHGVGMCQYGAKTMAEKGYGYKKILAKYYPKILIKKIY